MVRVFISEGSRRLARHLDDSLERWRIRHENRDFLRGEESLAYSFEEFSDIVVGLDYSALLELRTEIQRFREYIKSQKSKRYRDNIRDNDWLHDANEAQRKTVIYERVISNRLAETKNPNKKQSAFPQEFMNVAEEYLDSDVFRKIKDEAFRRINEQGL